MNFPQFLRNHGITTYRKGEVKDKHLSNADWIAMPCPICGGSKLWLGYNLKKNYFYCYAHGYAGVFALMKAWFPHLNALQRKELLAEIDDLPLAANRQESNAAEAEQQLALPPDIIPLLESPPHCEYLQSRNLNPKALVQGYSVGAIGSCTDWRYQNQLFFPVYDQAETLCSWQTRTIVQDEGVSCRYLSAGKQQAPVPLKTLLYGEHRCSYYDTIIICEGVFDALRINAFSKNNAKNPNNHAVATFGKDVTKEQVLRISKYPRRVLCFDADAQTAAKQLAFKLAAFSGTTDVVCLDAKDPAEAPDIEIERLLRFAGKW